MKQFCFFLKFQFSFANISDEVLIDGAKFVFDLEQ